MEQEKQQWFAMRDLKRPNAKLRAYEMLKDKVERVYTPMVKKTLMRNGKRCLVDVPYIPDLLFVYDCKSVIDPIVSSIPTFQYRFVRGETPHRGREVIVSDKEMEQFIRVTGSMEQFRYYTPDEVSPSMYGRKICVVGGSLDGCVGRLKAKRGSKFKELIIEMQGILAVGVQVSPEYIRFID